MRKSTRPRIEARTGTGTETVQLRLLQGQSVTRDWTLDDRTRQVGRNGVAEARAILRQSRPPQPRAVFSKAS